MKRAAIVALLLTLGCVNGTEVGRDAYARDGASVTLLPNARNTNYGASSPVKSSDLDDIQDCIVGSKHPERGIPIHAWEFTPLLGGAPVVSAWDFKAGAAGTTWVSSIRIPVGTRITKAHAAYKRSTGAGDATFSIERVSATGVGSGALVNHVDNVHDGAWQNYEAAAINYTTIVDEYYVISFTIGDNVGPGEFVGVTIFVDRL